MGNNTKNQTKKELSVWVCQGTARLRILHKKMEVKVGVVWQLSNFGKNFPISMQKY